jgi:hypothetical protein
VACKARALLSGGKASSQWAAFVPEACRQAEAASILAAFFTASGSHLQRCARRVGCYAMITGSDACMGLPEYLAVKMAGNTEALSARRPQLRKPE